MIQIGARAHDYGRDAPEKLFGKIAADGFTCVQLALKKTIAGVNGPADVTPELLEEISVVLTDSGLNVAVLGAYVELSIADEALRADSVREFLANIPFAKRLGADCIGTETTQMKNQKPGVTRMEALRFLADSLFRIMPTAEKYGVTVAVEPVHTHALNTPELAAELLKLIRSPKLKIIFDPVNLLGEEDVDGQHRLWDRCFCCFGSEIAAVHMKGVRLDETGSLVSCGFSESVVDYGYLFDRLKELPQKFSILREEVNPSHAKQDIAFLHGFLV